jgi:hypothetical protein
VLRSYDLLNVGAALVPALSVQFPLPRWERIEVRVRVMLRVKVAERSKRQTLSKIKLGGEVTFAARLQILRVINDYPVVFCAQFI